MNTEDIKLLYRYNSWANDRILNAAAKVSQEQFLAPRSFPHGGLRGTLTHSLFAEWIWLKRWLGESPAKHIEPEDFPTFESLRSRWLDEGKNLAAFVESLNDEKLAAAFRYTTTEGKPRENILWQAMSHVVNHGTQHRSEAAAMLTEFDCSPGDIDMILFLRERK